MDRRARPGGTEAAPQLVGRETVLGQLGEEVGRVVAGRFRTVLVEGPGGVGKTRVVAELSNRWHQRATLLSARCYRWGGTTSFGPWLEALDRHLRRLERQDVRNLVGSAADDLGAVLPSVELAAGQRGPEPGRDRVLDALAYLFARLSGSRPVLVVIDDLHLADPSAWEALRFLARRLADAPVGVLATARPAQLRIHDAPREVLVGLEDDEQLARVVLPPLSRRDVAAMVHDLLRADPRSTSSFVPDQLITWLMTRSRGHPLFVTSLVQALLDEGADLAAPRLERLPEALRERVALDVETLEPGERTLLETLTIVGRRIDLEGLAGITGRDLAELGVALETLARRQLVAEHGGGADLRYEVVHPLIGEVIYEGIGAARRSVLHRSVARTLQSSGQLGAAASHYARAGLRDDEAVDALFEAMAQAGERGLYREALAVLGGLIDVLAPGDRRWTRVLDTVTQRSEWVLSHLAEGDADVGVTAISRVVDVLEGSEDTGARATASFLLSAFHSFGQGRLAAAEESAVRAADLFRDAGDVEGELLAVNERAWIRGCRGDLDAQSRIAKDVLAHADAAGLDHPVTQAAGTAAYALGLQARFQDARELLEVSREAAARARNDYRIAWASAQGCLLESLSGRLTDAIVLGEAAFDADDAAADALAYEDLAHAYWLAGRSTDAIECLDRSVVRRPVLGSRRRAWGAALAGRLHGEAGRRGRARSSLERATATYDDGFLTWSCWAEWTEGWLAWADGKPRRALELLGRVSDRLHRMGAAAYEPLVLADLAEVAAELREQDRCAAAVARLRELADTTDGDLARWLATLVQARVELLRGDDEAAATTATSVCDALDEAGYAILAADAEQLAGQALLVRNRADAVRRLEQAAERYRRCGAAWRRERAVAVLMGLGARGRRAAAAVEGPASLTPRERQIAELTARGHTARDVGERLFIGKRTVETHLANIYAKLGIASKRELIGSQDELGLSRRPGPAEPDSVSRSVAVTEAPGDAPS